VITGLLLLGVFVLAVALQALFAGYETGFISANPIRLRYLAEEQHLGRAAKLLRYMSDPDQMLTMLLLGTNIGTVAGTIAFTRAMESWVAASGETDPVAIGSVAALITVAIGTPLFMIFAEIAPKSVFRQHPNRLTLALLPVMNAAYMGFAVIAWPIAKATRMVMRLTGEESQMISPFMSSLDDVRVLVDESADHGDIEREEQRMIHSVINLQSRLAKEIMVPRIDMQALPRSASRTDLVQLFVSTGRTRIPVYEDTIDAVVGITNAHDVLLGADTGDERIDPYVREVMHVPDTIGVQDLFKAMKEQKQRLAIVTDEYGGTDGLITIEDILEEIFGEIQDEHDDEERPIQQVGPRAYVLDARLSIEEAADGIGATIADEDVETIGGWLMHIAGRIPAQGEVVHHGGFRITVLEGGVNYLTKLRIDVSEGASRSNVSES
jgi:putative hemolysin